MRLELLLAFMLVRIDHSSDDPDRKPFEPRVTALEDEGERFARPVLIVHGDDHTYTIDHPVVRRGDETPIRKCHAAGGAGSPQVGWVRVVMTPGSDNPFASHISYHAGSIASLPDTNCIT